MMANPYVANVFQLSLDFKVGDGAPPGGRLTLGMDGVCDADKYEDDDCIVALWGTPARNDRILTASELAAMVRKDGVATLAPRLDCGFLLIVYERQADRLSIVTDRFGSLPFYHHRKPGAFIASSSFKQLFDGRGASESPGFDPLTVMEFFHFRRVFGTRSYDRSIELLPGASILTVEADGTSKNETYWRIDADKAGRSEDLLAEELAEALRDSMRVHMSDHKRYGLLLSGGLDARALLAAAPQPLLSFTTTPTPNNELAVARELARHRGAQHVYIQRPEQLLNEALAPSVALSGGMTVFNEVPFLGYGQQIASRADTLFMGLALDVMFCGHYLPKAPVNYAGRSGWHFKLQDLSGGLATRFTDTISYRLKTSDPMRVIASNCRANVRGHLIDCVQQEMDEGQKAGLRTYDLWEYPHLHNLSRHYSLLMAQSVRTFAACRLPALSNRLYDLCWSMQANDKANWAVYQKAIRRLNPDLMRVRNANTNIRADVPLRWQTAIKFSRGIANRILGSQRGATPSWWDRSWPEARQAISVNPNIQHAVRALPHSEQLKAVGMFDLDAIGQVVKEHMEGSIDHTVMLNELVTIDRALRSFR